MNTFTLEVQSPGANGPHFTDIVSFSGRDSSGDFSILAHAERRMTVLMFGLASFKHENGLQEFLALPGGLLYFRNNELLIATQSFAQSIDFKTITTALESEIRVSETEVRETRRSLRRLDEEILRRLSRLNLGSDL